MVERALALGWQLLDLRHYDRKLPPGLHPDGALIERLWNEPLARRLRKLGCPTVRVGAFPHPRDDVYPSVVGDLPTAGRLAAEHLAERNFRHVGFVGYAPLSNFKPLYEAFQERAVELGCECHLLAFPPFPVKRSKTLSLEQKSERRDRQLRSWLEHIQKPIGMLGFSGNIACSICVRSLEAGLEIPAEVAVIACGNDRLACECAPVPLSAVEYGGEEEGEAAVRLLQDLMAGKPPPSATVLVTPREVVVRRSTDVLATTDPTVARAILHLWKHLERDLSVDAVAAEVGVSRRRLERAFQAQLGRGVHAELQRRRLEKLCELLRTTDDPFRDLAPRVGFRSSEYGHACFRKAFGMTPRRYRQRHARGAVALRGRI